MRLSQQTYLLSEFLVKKAGHFQMPQLQRKAVVHGHCHHKAVMRMGAEETALKKLGLDCTFPDPGCCGMAGAFGFEKDHYDVSMKVGERLLLPAVRSASKDTLIIADGFSCREQIAQTTDRHALHLAEVIQMAMREGQDGQAAVQEYPEAQYTLSNQEQTQQALAKTLLPVGAGLVVFGGILAWIFKKRR
jgi:Fe-S oxidoreductase